MVMRFLILVLKKIRKDNVEDAVEVFFRVRSVMKNRKILVKSDGKVISKVMRLHLAPGEMESVKITKEQLDECGNSIEICVEDN